MLFVQFPILGKLSATFLLIILSVIALLHFYWAVGGNWGFANAVPSKENGEPLFVPSKFSCVVVGVGLSFFIYIILESRIGIIYKYPSYFRGLYSKWSPLYPIFDYSILTACFIFLIRGIGDFKYVGIFKKIKNTSFGRLDTMYYTPLCILISGLFFLFYLYQPFFPFIGR